MASVVLYALLIIDILALIILGILAAVAAGEMSHAGSTLNRAYTYFIGALVSGIIGGVLLILGFGLYIYYGAELRVVSTGDTDFAILILVGISMLAVGIMGALAAMASDRINCVGTVTTGTSKAFTYGIYIAVISIILFILDLIILIVFFRNNLNSVLKRLTSGTEAPIDKLTEAIGIPSLTTGALGKAPAVRNVPPVYPVKSAPVVRPSIANIPTTSNVTVTPVVKSAAVSGFPGVGDF